MSKYCQVIATLFVITILTNCSSPNDPSDGGSGTSDNKNGTLVHVDSDNPGDTAYGVWGDGTFIYLANGDGGIHTYKVE